MASFFFTFGSHPAFPYDREEFVQVIAPDIHEAARIFRSYHPDRPGQDGVLNCAFFYTEEKFNGFKDKFYPGKAPAEVLTEVKS